MTRRMARRSGFRRGRWWAACISRCWRTRSWLRSGGGGGDGKRSRGFCHKKRGIQKAVTLSVENRWRQETCKGAIREKNVDCRWFVDVDYGHGPGAKIDWGGRDLPLSAPFKVVRGVQRGAAGRRGELSVDWLGRRHHPSDQGPGGLWRF